MGGKASAPAAPDYTAIASASKDAAQMQYKLGQEQLDWGKAQYNQVWPYAQQYLTSQISATEAEQQRAGEAKSMYDTTYKPLETSFANTAADYATPARSEANAGRAMADVAAAFDGQRKAALSSLESYGIDPSQTRYGALDLGTRISQAAATASAGTQSRLNTEATGLALQGEAINIGRGYPGAIAGAYDTATRAGSAGLGSANQSFATGGSVMGTPAQYMAAGNGALGVNASIANSQGNYGLGIIQSNNQVAAGTSSGIGSIIGAGIGIGAIAI